MSAAEKDLGINTGIVKLISDKKKFTKQGNQKRMDVHIDLNIKYKTLRKKAVIIES